MESVCINCKHFVKGSFNSNTNIWGDCTKPREGVPDIEGEKKPGLFKWGDATCPDFKPNQQAEA